MLQLPSLPLPLVSVISFPAAAVISFPAAAAAAVGLPLFIPAVAVWFPLFTAGCKANVSALLFLGGMAAPAAVVYFLEARSRHAWFKARNALKVLNAANALKLLNAANALKVLKAADALKVLTAANALKVLKALKA